GRIFHRGRNPLSRTFGPDQGHGRVAGLSPARAMRIGHDNRMDRKSAFAYHPASFRRRACIRHRYSSRACHLPPAECGLSPVGIQGKFHADESFLQASRWSGPDMRATSPAPLAKASKAPPRAISSFFELMKLKMVFHILITTFVGYYLGSKVEMDMPLLWRTLLGTGILAIGAFALNQAIEKDYDKLMERTRARPIPTERVGQKAAFGFGVLCFLVGTAYLWIWVNVLTAV